MRKYLVIISSILVVIGACQPKNYLAIQKSEVHYYTLDSAAVVDEAITALIAPYKQQLSEEMNAVLATAALDMPKNKPESLLGNWVCDAILNIAQQQYKDSLHLAISNYGGLRIPNLAKGDVTRGNLFELMPFDNMLVVVQLDGSTLKQWLHHIAKEGGWPVSYQLQMMIGQDMAEQMTLNKKAIVDTATYHVLTSDYVANGGDKCDFLVDLPRKNLGLLFRDALIAFAEQETTNNKSLSTKITHRIHYGE